MPRYFRRVRISLVRSSNTSPPTRGCTEAQSTNFYAQTINYPVVALCLLQQRVPQFVWQPGGFLVMGDIAMV